MAAFAQPRRSFGVESSDIDGIDLFVPQRDDGIRGSVDGIAFCLPARHKRSELRQWQSSSLWCPSSFAFGKDDVLMTLSSLFSAAELTFESERALEVALQLFRKGSADFADCLHVALAVQAGEQPLWTFDKGAASASGAQLLAKA